MMCWAVEESRMMTVELRRESELVVAISLPHTHTHTVHNFFLSVTNQGGLAETVFIAYVSEGFYLQIVIFENQKSKRAVNFDKWDR